MQRNHEELSYWASWASLAGLLIGIPGFLLLFIKGNAVIGVLALIVIGCILFFRWYLNQPETTIIEVTKELDFHDPQARKATLVRHQTARANHKGITEFWVRNITSDGTIENILVDGKLPDEVRHVAGTIEVCKRFQRPLVRGRSESMNLSYDLIDSFDVGRTQAMIHTISSKTKQVRMVVNFHPDKPCTTAKLFLTFGGQEHKALQEPKISRKGRRIEVEIKRPQLGAEYYLEWEW